MFPLTWCPSYFSQTSPRLQSLVVEQILWEFRGCYCHRQKCILAFLGAHCYIDLLSYSDCQELYTVIIWTALLRRRWTGKDTYSKGPPTKTQISFNWWRTCLHLKIKDILLCIAPHPQTLEWPPLASVSPHENILLLVNGVTWKKALCTSVYSNLNFDGNLDFILSQLVCRYSGFTDLVAKVLC